MNSVDMSMLSPLSLGRLKKIDNIGLFCNMISFLHGCNSSF